MTKFLLYLLFASVAVTAYAEGTRTWEQTRFEEFEKGTARGVAIRSDGMLELAPRFLSLYTSPSTYIWAIGADPEGNVYAASGSPARVYRITPEGRATIVFEPEELQIQALVVDSKGVVYAATSPDGRVYRIERKPGATPLKPAAPKPEGETGKAASAGTAPSNSVAEQRPTKPPVDPAFTSSIYFEPRTRYIWALALDRDNNLYVATGDRGEVFRVSAPSKGVLFFKSDEAHIRTLAFDRAGNLIAGSDGSGLIYRVASNGEAFVLYSAPKKEITALAVDQNNNIYAAAVGEKRGPSSVPASMLAPTQNAALTGAAGQQQGGPAQGQQAATPLPATPAFSAVGGSDIYRIAADGSPKRVWSSREDVVYALGFDRAGRLIAGTGNRGRIIAIRREDEYTNLVKSSASQVTAFAQARDGGLYAATSNLGKLFLMGPRPEEEGSFESDVFDARIFSRWGRPEVRGSGGYQLFARSGNVDNPDRNWSPWKQAELDRDVPLDVPPARFIQWKAVLVSGRTEPRVESVALNYLPKNMAPHVSEVAVQVNSRIQQTPRLLGEGSPSVPANANTPQPVRDRDWISVRWNARDDNDDTLAYSVYYRGDGEMRWRLLRDRLIDRFYSFEAGLLPDGAYEIKVVASDAPSHTPEDALSDEHESRRFEVDNTAPRIEDLNAKLDGNANALHVTFRALDGSSTVRRAEYSVNAGEWQIIDPIGQLSDSRIENYDFLVPLPVAQRQLIPEEGRNKKRVSRTTGASAVEETTETATPVLATAMEHIVVVRVWDRADNMGTAKVVVRP